jgi:hypothetical protein
VILDSGDVSCLAQPRLQQHDLDAGDLSLLENLNVGDVGVTPMDAEDGAEGSLVKTLMQS